MVVGIYYYYVNAFFCKTIDDDDTIELNVINCFVSRASSAEKYWKLMNKNSVIVPVQVNYNCIKKICEYKIISMHYSWFCWFVLFFWRSLGEDIWFTIHNILHYAVIYVHYNANITPARPAFNWTINYFLVISSGNRVTNNNKWQFRK